MQRNGARVENGTETRGAVGFRKTVGNWQAKPRRRVARGAGAVPIGQHGELPDALLEGIAQNVRQGLVVLAVTRKEPIVVHVQDPGRHLCKDEGEVLHGRELARIVMAHEGPIHHSDQSSAYEIVHHAAYRGSRTVVVDDDVAEVTAEMIVNPVSQILRISHHRESDEVVDGLGRLDSGHIDGANHFEPIVDMELEVVFLVKHPIIMKQIAG